MIVRPKPRARRALFALIVIAIPLQALESSAWRFRQSIEIDRSGPLKIVAPVEIVDRAQADLRDLRLLGPDRAEIPFALVRPTAATPTWRKPEDVRVALEQDATVVTLRTGTDLPLDALELLTSARSFIKPARVETSFDGRTWQLLAGGLPFFRQDNASQTTLALDGRSTNWIRVTLAGPVSRAVPIAGALLRESAGAPAASVELTGAKLLRTEEFARDTLLTVDLGAANLHLASLELDTAEPLFNRLATAFVREFRDGQIVERTIGTGVFYRAALDGAPAATTSLSLETSVPLRELVLRIENADSPPLRIAGVRVRHRPVYLAFAAPAPGQYQLLAGNRHVAAPRYDLASLSTELGRLPLATPRVNEVDIEAVYRAHDPLAALALEGAALDTAPWKHRRALAIARPGVQQLELDAGTLALCQSDFGDLRLLRDGKQVPYVLERTSLEREVAVQAQPDSAGKKPGTSRWKIVLPHASLPLRRLVLHTATPLFQRRLHLSEHIENFDGSRMLSPIAEADWIRTPDEPARPLTLPLRTRPQGTTLELETHDGDNPPLALSQVQGFHPVTRVLFYTTDTAPLTLIFGYASASAPRYDLSLVATHLLDAEKNPVVFGAPEPHSPGAASGLLSTTGARALFWTVLAAVVALLLVVIAKLLPKR